MEMVIRILIMNFSTFAQYLYQLEEQSSRLTMTAKLAELFILLKENQQQNFLPKIDKQQISKIQTKKSTRHYPHHTIRQLSEIKIACYLMQGSLVPSYQSLEFNLSVKMLIRVLTKLKQDAFNKAKSINSAQTDLFGQTTEASSESAAKEYKKLGDLGLVAEQILAQEQEQKQKDKKMSAQLVTAKSVTQIKPVSLGSSCQLSIIQVYQALVKIAQDGGTGSQERKNLALQDLLSKLNPLSARYVVRIVIGKLRLGFSTMTMLDALSWTVSQDKSWAKKLEEAWQKKADVGLLAEQFLLAENPTTKQTVVDNYQAEIGLPIVPVLCQRLESYQEMVEKLGEIYAEPKYDGLRVQIHFQNGKVKAFTRNLEDATHMFPELQKVAKKIKQNCILDSEAIGIDPKTGDTLAFQATMTRKRKYNIGDQAKEVPLRFYAFDVLAVNEEILINQPLFKRKQILADLFEDNNILEKTSFIKTTNAQKLADYHASQLAKGLEGAVMKKADSLYKSGRKGWRWVKIKEEAGVRGKLSDTLDLVVMGYYFGKGKRTSFGIGAFLAGVLDGEELKTVAKIGTGLSDEQLKEMKTRCNSIEKSAKPSNYKVPKELTPDVWVQSELVVEIAADEITKSPLHSAKLALRFPRLIKFRDDKNWDQATTLKELKQMK